MAILAPITVASIEAQIPTTSLSFSEANRSYGISLDGNFAIQYKNGVMTEQLSLNVTTANGTADGFTDFSYLCNLVGQADTVSYAAIDANAPTAARSSAPRMVGKGAL